jgi:hypothetical protein
MMRSAVVLLVLLLGWFQFAYWSSTNDCGRTIPAGAERMMRQGKITPFVEKT